MIGAARIRGKVREALAGDVDPHRLAAGFAIGVFFGFTPLVSLHVVLSLVAAVALRASKVAAVAGAWVNNPYTMPFVYWFCFRIGERLLGTRVPPPGFRPLTLSALLEAAPRYLGPLFLGTTVVGLAAAGASYVVVRRIAVRLQSARLSARPQGESRP